MPSLVFKEIKQLKKLNSYFSLADFIRNLFKQNKKCFSNENDKKI